MSVSPFLPLNPVLPDWRDRRVWIVGASSGIGAALAHEALARGAHVAVSARRAQALRELFGERAIVVPLDVVDAAAVATAADDLRARWGGIDLVLWVAGIYEPMRAEAFDLPRARAMLEANFGGALNGLAALLPAMLERGDGRIALVGSVAGYGGLPRALVYGPTKAALINLAESLYLDLHPRGIGVHLVNPGFVETPATAVNDFRMPALIGAGEAARATLDGIAAGRFEIHYPRRFTLVMKLLRLLPYRAYFAAIRRATGQAAPDKEKRR